MRTVEDLLGKDSMTRTVEARPHFFIYCVIYCVCLVKKSEILRVVRNRGWSGTLPVHGLRGWRRMYLMYCHGRGGRAWRWLATPRTLCTVPVAATLVGKKFPTYFLLFS